MTWKKIATWSAVALCATVWITSGPESAAAQECEFDVRGPCTKTSIAGLRACRAETRQDLWLELAGCRNLSDGVRECAEEARDEVPESKEECLDQCSARQEVCDALGQAAYDPVIDPADFVDPADIPSAPNPYWPLVPGTVWTYDDDGDTATVTVTDNTVEILGVTCVEVLDVELEDGEKVEETRDWYAQDVDGNVWYFGEISQEFEDGELVGIDGSWKAGEDGAKPGILMFADPQPGTVFRQEFLLGEAEDIGEVLSLAGDESSPVADCNGGCLVVKDTTPLEPDADEDKYYVAGVGLIVEIDNEDGERAELVDFVMP